MGRVVLELNSVGLLTLLYWRERRKMAPKEAATDGIVMEDQQASRKTTDGAMGWLSEREEGANGSFGIAK